MIRKAKIRDSLYDVVTFDDYMKNKARYSEYVGTIAVDHNDGLIYPLRNPTDIRPGVYDYGGVTCFKPPHSSETAIYSEENVINFSNARNLREVIEAQDQLAKAERSILTTIDNVTLPEIGESDTPAMKALKEAIISKHIDLDKYDYRFGTENYPNDKRLLKRDSITLPKLKAYADALDISLTLTLEDKSSTVPNPMGKVITVKLNGGTEDENNEV